jgi:CBS domain-containing protein
MQARDIMIEALTVQPDCSVRDLAVLLLERGLDGACVVENDELDSLVGVVTTMDLVFQEKQVHLPSILSFMDFAIPLEPPSRLRAELDKIAGTRVEQIMSREPVTVDPERPVSEVARMMVDQHLTIVPVLSDSGQLLGMITKQALLRAVLG